MAARVTAELWAEVAPLLPERRTTSNGGRPWRDDRPPLKPRGKGRPHGSGPGRTRYVVERGLSWFGNNRRLKLCCERTAEHFQAFHELAACPILARRVHAATAVVK